MRLLQVNSKAPVDWCIFGRFGDEQSDDVTDTYVYKQCNAACQPIYKSIDINVKSNPGGYQFCDSNGNFTSDVDSCVDCLYNSVGLTILGNSTSEGMERIVLILTFY